MSSSFFEIKPALHLLHAINIFKFISVFILNVIVEVLLFNILFLKYIIFLNFRRFSKIIINQKSSLLTSKLLMLIFQMRFLLQFILYFNSLRLQLYLLLILPQIIPPFSWKIDKFLFLLLICKKVKFPFSGGALLVNLIVDCYKYINLIKIHFHWFLIGHIVCLILA